MCGIAGILTPEARPLGRDLWAMTEALRHRGPDGAGHVALTPGRAGGTAVPGPPDGPARVFFGHRRLSIIDVAGSAQPLANEDGSVWVTFNGEIYNYLELRRELAVKGHALREKGDTEVLVHLWEEHGPDMAERLRGMFAFAIYDARRDVLFLARDRFGEKPLYLMDAAGGFAFASEIQALAALPSFSRERDDVALAQYFRYGFIPGPRTAFAAVSVLPPGHVLVRRDGRCDIRPYAVPGVRGAGTGCDIAELGERLDAAVASRLLSDVPLGCFLSGGLDSSLVASAMARSGGGQVRAFTIAVGEDGGEAAVAARIAAAIGARHAVRRVEPDFVTVSETLAPHFGQPFADISAVPTYLVSRETRREVKVALSGDGGDELFAGYERYANYRATALAAGLPAPLRRALAALAVRLPVDRDFRRALADFIRSAVQLPEKGENHSALYYRDQRLRIFTPDFAAARDLAREERVARFSALFAEAASPDPVERWMEVDQRMYLADDILTKVDVASMAVSLETRAPLLDHDFAAYANALPLRSKLSGRVGKLPLRALAASRLPAGVAGLPKKGFTVPLAAWIRGELGAWCENLVFGTAVHWEPYLRPEAVRGLWRAHQAGVADHAMRLWLVAAFGLWVKSLPSLGRPGA